MSRYNCRGFNINNAFGHRIGEMFRNEILNTNSIVYIPGSPEKIEKAREKYIPAFRNHFKNENMDPTEAQEQVKKASFVMLMGGDPFKQKMMCEKLGLMDILKNYQGVMLGFSAGAMLMSKYIIITPCSDEYPEFHIEEGLDLDGISIYPHNNTSNDEYPNTLVVGDETYQKEDLIKVAEQYGEYYLLQDNFREDGKVDVSIIKSYNGVIEDYTEENGKIWIASKNGILLKNNLAKTK